MKAQKAEHDLEIEVICRELNCTGKLWSKTPTIILGLNINQTMVQK